MMRPGTLLAAMLCVLAVTVPVRAEVTRVTIASRTPVLDGQAFGATGAYEKLTGTVEIALDPRDPHNARIVDVQYAAKSADGKVHATADLYVLRPADGTKGNGVLLFEVVNRGHKGLLGRFNRAAGSDDPTTAAQFGDGYLMREGYTLVYLGWEFDVPAPGMRLDSPIATLPDAGRVAPIAVPIIVNQQAAETFLIDEPAGRPPVGYPPLDPNSATDTLTVRDRFWSMPTTIPRDRWHFVVTGNGAPKIALDGGFEPGRTYEVTYRPTNARAAGIGMAVFRDVAAAFRFGAAAPVRGSHAYIFGISQSGRFLRQFLHDGFVVDERNRRVFDAVWPHIAGGSLGPFNERFAATTHGKSFVPTAFPFTDLPQADGHGHRDGLLSVYTPEQLPKIVYTNTSVEYWGGGRAAALTHTTLDGAHDAKVPENVRMYLLAGTQHGESAFPPRATSGQALNNPTPQGNVMRALLRGLDRWVRNGEAPPASRHPMLADKTLVAVSQLQFPHLPGLRDPKTIEGPMMRMASGSWQPLPFLVPQVDADGNERGGIRVPEVAVPLATSTGWNFRADAVGHPETIYMLLGSYVPFARTRTARMANGDPRPSIEERYANKDDYLSKIDAATAALVKDRYLLAEDAGDVHTRAATVWDSLAGSTATARR